MNNNPIGIFDSGVGGLSVFSQMIQLLPNEHYIYFGDTINLPYGSKTQDQLINITSNIFNFFESKNVKAVIMACNTTSALTYDILKNKYNFKIYPIVQRVVKQIANKHYNRVGVFATEATINSHAYKKEFLKYSPNTEIFEIASSKWVNIVENGLQDQPDSINNIKLQLDLMLKNNIDKIILGCTHYPYLINILNKFAPEELFINPAIYFAQDIYKDLKENNLLSSNQDYNAKFYVSSKPSQFMSSSKLFYDVKNAEEITITKALVNLSEKISQ